MVNDNTKEVLGQLTRWIVLAGSALAGLGAVAVVLSALGPTLEAGRGWSIVSDAVGATSGYMRIRAISRPPLQAQSAGLYWRGPDGALRNVVIGRSGRAYLKLPAGLQSGQIAVASVPTPYGAQARPKSMTVAHLTKIGTQVAVLDLRSIVAVTAQQRLADNAEDLWFYTCRQVPLLRLAEAKELAYLSTLPLADYDRARVLLRQGPAGAVLAAANDWYSQASANDVLQTLRRVNGNLRRACVLITEDVELAREMSAARLPVVLVGSPAKLGPTGVVCPDWDAVVEYLKRKPAPRRPRRKQTFRPAQTKPAKS